MKLVFEPIGIIHTPFAEAEGTPIQPPGALGMGGYVEIRDEYRAALADIEGFSHIILIYHFHRVAGFDLKVVPFLDERSRGLFATRAPRRPNPIGVSVVRLLSVEGNRLEVDGVDIIDGTPLLDIKPFVPAFDSPSPVRTGWLDKTAGRASFTRDDGRFVGRTFPEGPHRTENAGHD